ncbi:MAG TPA: helix-turn-helix domain-containing protein [Pseudonocardia sp.]|nr:helix-turn-helix domain-containing protein [Pseudonocardia sp.]
MTDRADAVIESDPRLERVLDAAGELLLRWGYRRVTIEEVARHAGIGKGTVYLHFPTKEALFLTVLLRAQRRSVVQLTDRMLADPAEALLSRVTRSVYLAVEADPVLRALYLGDVAVLGRLTQEAAETLGELAAERVRAVRRHLELLRGAGCARTDLGIDEQVHVLQAVTMGHFVLDGLPAAFTPRLDPEVRADLLAHTVAGALEVADPPHGALAAVVPQLIAVYTAVRDLFDEEWRRRVR